MFYDPRLTSLDRPHCVVCCRLVPFLIAQILVTSIEVNKATLNCGLRPLDLITQFDGKSVESLCDKFGQCFLKSKTMQSTDVWVARTSGVPPMLGLQSK